MRLKDTKEWAEIIDNIKALNNFGEVITNEDFEELSRLTKRHQIQLVVFLKPIAENPSRISAEDLIDIMGLQLKTDSAYRKSKAKLDEYVGRVPLADISDIGEVNFDVKNINL